LGNSTITLQTVYDTIVAKGIPDPRLNASGYGDTLAVELASQIMAELIAERFNWKWNRATAAAILTNSWQQDYPQPAQKAGEIGWGEDSDLIDINNTVIPKPMWHPSWRRALSRTSSNAPGRRIANICWMQNNALSLGTWPGAGVTFYNLITTAPQPQNPIMSMLDKNGNILIVTGYGITGGTAPYLPASSAEGTTVLDGSVTWTCVSPTSQGFRLDALPSATGPTYQLLPYYQIEPPRFTDVGQTLDPIPDSFSRAFFRGLESECLIASPNPADVKRGQTAKIAWLNALMGAMKQGDRELNIFALVPATSVVEERYWGGGPYSAEVPY
jgi:hypothetical protein